MAQMTTRNQDTVSSFCRYTVGVASAPCSFGNLMSACPFFGIAYSDRLKAGHAVAKEIQNAHPTNASSEQSVSRKDPKMPQLKRDSTMAVTIREAKVYSDAEWEHRAQIVSGRRRKGDRSSAYQALPFNGKTRRTKP